MRREATTVDLPKTGAKISDTRHSLGPHCDTLVRPRRRTMGLDGGTIISRSDILRGQSWDVANADGGASTSSRGGQLSAGKVHTGRRRADPAERRRARWSHCALSGEPLREPIVCCGLGRLYNREALIEHALAQAGTFVSERSTYAYANRTNATSHVRSLRDFFPVHLTAVATGGRGGGSGGGSHGRAGKRSREEAAPEFECPVWGVRCGDAGAGEFVAIRPCGHVVSDRARRDAEATAVEGRGSRDDDDDDDARGGGGASPHCPVCDVRFDRDSCVHVNSFDVSIGERLRTAVDARRAAEDDRRHRRRARKERGVRS